MFEGFLEKSQEKFNETKKILIKEMFKDYDAFWKEALSQATETKLKLENEIKTLGKTKDEIETKHLKLSEEIVLFKGKKEEQEKELGLIKTKRDELLKEVTESREKLDEITQKEESLKKKEEELHQLRNEINIERSVLEAKQASLKKIWGKI